MARSGGSETDGLLDHQRVTLYHLAATPDEYERVAAFLETDPDTPGFPTVYATRDQRIVAVISTHPRSDAVIAGPMALAPEIENGAPLMRRLGTFYEGWLRALGVKQYLFSANADNERYIRSLKRMGYDEYERDGEYVWFRRTLTEAESDERF